MVTSPLVSVVIPTYNQCQYLPQALESVFGQTFGDFEVVIGDNASSDTTKDVIEEYRKSESRIIAFRNESTVSAHDNYNLCLQRIHPGSKYVVFLTSDDWWEAQFLQRVTAVAEEYQCVAVTHVDGYRTDQSGRIINKYSELWREIPQEGLHQAVSQLYRGDYILFHGTLINRQRLRELFPANPLFDANLKYVADYNLWIQLFTRGAFGFYLPEPLVYYRKHEAAHTIPKNVIPRLREHVTIFRDKLADVCPPELEAVRQEALLLNLKQLGFALLEAGQAGEALPVLLEANELAGRQQLDIRAAVRLAKSPLPSRLTANTWRMMTAVAQKVR